MKTSSASGYLTKAQACNIWNAASFSIQEFDLPLNVGIAITGLSPTASASRVLIHRAAQRLKYWAPSAGGTVPWLAVSSLTECEHHTIALLHVRFSIIDQFRDWFDRRAHAYVPGLHCSVEFPTNGQRPIRRHHELLARCLQATDPAIFVRQGEDRKALLDIVCPQPRPRRTYLPLAGRRFEVAECIGKAGQDRVRHEGMAAISAFDDGAFDFLKTGWESSEHNDRLHARAERHRAEIVVSECWPPDGNPVFDLKRIEEIAKIRGIPARERLRSWQPWCIS